jgi:hypothetical protein
MLHITASVQCRKGKLARQHGIRSPHDSTVLAATGTVAASHLMCQLSHGQGQESSPANLRDPRQALEAASCSVDVRTPWLGQHFRGLAWSGYAMPCCDLSSIDQRREHAGSGSALLEGPKEEEMRDACTLQLCLYVTGSGIHGPAASSRRTLSFHA